jgi:hypothetical protein
MRKILFLLISISLICNTLYSQRGKLVQRLVEKRLDRNVAETTGPEPDYSNLYYWAASPYKVDCSDSIPSYLKGEQRDSSVDIFYIHPTSFISDVKIAAWNADLSDTALNNFTDTHAILYQASVYNASGRIFAPRYRQANIKAFLVRTTPRAQKAFDLAYSDIKKAFEYYLQHDNHGRPIIIASHSQGSLHAIRLLQDFFDGKPLQKQLVCAYIIGYQIEKNAFAHIPIGNSPSQTGCVVGWRSYQKGEMPKGVEAENGNSICVNPLTWTTSTQYAPPELNLGFMAKYSWKLKPHYAGVEIEPKSQILWVTLPADADSTILKMKNLHLYDYNLYWMNIRQNVKQRVDAFFKYQ